MISGWFLFLIGSFVLIEDSQSRAVNISNTWTLPEQGFSTFYRFFQDKISWFEADAVCQFHHANLVTVDNSLQFDAARAFLKELDVTEPVWIGLMRPQSSDRFMWTNSKLLDPISGYWAESLPVIESPLCAVIDPVRDFRWHALRCGGPETAAFLCEMEVPEWAAECTIRALPSLTIQYMSDSATVELTRDCGEEGVKQMTCRGKQDRDMILSEMLCNDEFESLNADNSIKSTSESNQKSADEVKSVASDNNEENTIESQVNKIETSAEKVIDKFNVDEMMLGDQPYADDSVTEAEIKPTKTSKKAVDPPKKTAKQMKNNSKEVSDMNKEEVMMGDQPVENLRTTAADISTDEILPHQKKSLVKDLKRQENVGIPTKHPYIDEKPAIRSFVNREKIWTTIDWRSRRETEQPGLERIPITPSSFRIKTTTTTASPTTAASTTITRVSSTQASITSTITEPAIKITKKSFNTVKDDTLISHTKDVKNESVLINDHFIPPMLMVRSQTHPPHSENTTTSKPFYNKPANEVSIQAAPATLTQTVKQTSSPSPAVSSSAGVINPSKPTPLKIAPPTLGPVQHTSSTTSAAIQSSTSLVSTTVAASSSASPSTESSFTTTTTTVSPNKINSTSKTVLYGEPTKSVFHQPHGPKKPDDSPNIPDLVTSTSVLYASASTTQHILQSTPLPPRLIVSTPSPTVFSSSSASPLVPIVPTQTTTLANSENTVNTKLETTTASQKFGDIKKESLVQASADNLNSGENTDDSLLNHPKRSSSSNKQPKHHNTSDKHSEKEHHEKHHEQIDYSDPDGFHSYKPNRRRVLIKPTTRTYIQKIFG